MTKFKELGKEELPRERAIKYGFDTLSDADLIAILLRTGSKKENVKELALKILKEMNDLKGLQNSRLSKLASIDGVGKVKAITILSALELGKRLNKEETKQLIKIKESVDVYNYFRSELENETQEKFMVLFLNNQNDLLASKVMFIGIANQSLVEPKEIFKEAMLYNASRIIVLHNHPSGNPSPSKEDYLITDRIKKSGQLLNIILLDHLIIGKNNYFSFYTYLKGD